jgi:hypothetical protein
VKRVAAALVALLAAPWVAADAAGSTESEVDYEAIARVAVSHPPDERTVQRFLQRWLAYNAPEVVAGARQKAIEAVVEGTSRFADGFEARNATPVVRPGQPVRIDVHLPRGADDYLFHAFQVHTGGRAPSAVLDKMFGSGTKDSSQIQLRADGRGKLSFFGQPRDGRQSRYGYGLSPIFEAPRLLSVTTLVGLERLVTTTKGTQVFQFAGNETRARRLHDALHRIRIGRQRRTAKRD